MRHVGRVVAAVGCALVGLFLLTGASLHLSFGDGVTLITAFAWAVWLIGTGEVTRRFDTFALIFVQVLTIGIGSVVIAAFEGVGTVTGAVVLAVARHRRRAAPRSRSASRRGRSGSSTPSEPA